MVFMGDPPPPINLFITLKGGIEGRKRSSHIAVVVFSWPGRLSDRDRFLLEFYDPCARQCFLTPSIWNAKPPRLAPGRHSINVKRIPVSIAPTAFSGPSFGPFLRGS